MAARVIHQGDEAKMNMTPMIDMTFLLVVFFMLTIDLSTKEFFPVELPYATQGNEDKEVQGEVRRFVINLSASGMVYFKNYEFDLASEDPGVQDDAIQALQDAIRETQGNDPTLWEKDGASKIPVMIHGDWGAKWKYVQWIMQACAHPDIKIYKLQFAVKRPPGADKDGKGD